MNGQSTVHMARRTILEFSKKQVVTVHCLFTLLISTGLDKKFDDMSQTSGTPFVSGTKSNSTPTCI